MEANALVPVLSVDFAGELKNLDGASSFFIGREADLALDDNPYLHRRFLEIRREHELWWLINVGAQLTASVSESSSGVHAWLPPGGRMPIVFASTIIRFTAGPTHYEVWMELSDAPYVSEAPDRVSDGSTTIGRVVLTLDQRLLLVSLAEMALRRGAPGVAEIPTSANAAARLGWTLKKFEKKIDNVCDKLTNKGVRGLKGEIGNLAASRRARLVEYALSARIITSADLDLLDRPAVDVRGDD
jgi:hypothetical protein